MKIAVVGASGTIGSRIVAEAAGRGHQVSAVSRRKGAVQPAPGVTAVQADARNADDVANLARDHEAVVVSVSARKEGDTPIPEVVRTVVENLGADTRLFVVGGAGSLEVAPGVQLVDTPHFPEAYKSEVLQQREALELLRASDVDYTYLSPAIEIAPGERTGRYRVGGDQVLSDGEGRSFITAEDYAVAVLDELETPQHRRRRYTVAY